jgi:hypothetical protein
MSYFPSATVPVERARRGDHVVTSHREWLPSGATQQLRQFVVHGNLVEEEQKSESVVSSPVVRHYARDRVEPYHNNLIQSP